MKQKRSPFLVLFVAVGLLLAGNTPAVGQVATASLTGTITDPQGAVVVGAKVTLKSRGTGGERSVETNELGEYRFLALAPGQYDLTVEADGFRQAVRENLTLLVNVTTQQNVTLELGAVTESIIIEAGTAALNTTDASLGNVITPQQVESLPMEARNVMSLLTLQPGVVFSGDPTDQRSGSVAGGRSDQANVTLDGVDVNDQQTQNALSTSLPIPLESVQEFRFTTSNAGADQGRSSGGQVGFVTKSGSNEFHGSAFWTHRNTSTTANDFFNNRAGIAVPKLLRNQFGGSLGGPVIRDRLFFFGVYEGNRRREESNELRVVPTASLRDGVLIYRCANPADCPGGTVAGLTGSHAVPAGHFGLSPVDVRTIDPQGLGVNPAMLPVLQGFPGCNDFTQGLDATGSAPGLNFCGFRFNAPIALDNNIWVSRWDFNITRDARHMLSWRGTLGDLVQDVTAQQFPGQPTASALVDNSKGMAITYTAILSNNMTNVFRYGLTRQGREFTGQQQDTFSIRSFSLPFATNRALIRKIPTHNVVNDFTYAKGRHTWQFGTNMRFISNKRTTFANSFATFAINDGFCAGLCNSIPLALGDPGDPVLGQFPELDGAFLNPFKRSLMALYGMITQIGSAFIFDGSQNQLASGQGVDRKFVVNEYEFYGQDTWRVFRDLTLTLGLRYTYSGVPHEANGLQVQQTVDVQQWFAARRALMNAGLPQANLPLLAWDLSGPANNRPGFFRKDKNNFAPNFSFAYSPSMPEGFLARLFGGPGKSVIRGGFRLVYDRVGGSFVVTQDLTGAVGLVTNVINLTGTLDYGGAPCTTPPTSRCAAPRFSGFGSLPAVTDFVSTPQSGFPATPPPDLSNLGFIIDNNLRTPYAYAINFTYGRELPFGMALEVGYVSRLGHKLLAKADLGAPAIYHRDPASGMRFNEAINQLFVASDRGSAPVSSIAPIPYFENVFAGLAGVVPGETATQVVYRIARPNFPSFTDALISLEFNAADFDPDYVFPTFFQPQFVSLPAWTNLGASNYHALQVNLNKRFQQGLLFNFNYTFSKSIDNGSEVENTDRLGGQIADAFFPRNFFGLSDFDLQHQMTANWVYELPFGRGKMLGSDVNSVLDYLIGGWQVSGIIRWRGAFPITFENGFNFPTNFFLTGPGTQVCPVNTGVRKNAPGGPNLFGGTDAEIDAAFACLDNTLSGSSGSRNSIRGAKFFNLDFGLRKSLNMPFENHKLIFDWQVFNLPNHANFDDRTLRTNPESRSTFGRYVSTIGGDERSNNGRVMQFGFRYVF